MPNEEWIVEDGRGSIRKRSEEEEELAKCGKKQKDENVNRRLNRRLDGEEDEEKLIISQYFWIFCQTIELLGVLIVTEKEERKEMLD
jgi:hypothetical protein